MAFLTELWLPIVLSAVFVFIISSVIHMATPMHKGDVRKLPKEDAVMDALRANGVPPGAYMFPCCECMKDMSSPEMIEKRKRGPVGWLMVLPPGGCNMGTSLICWFVFALVVGALSGYVGWHSLGAGAHYLTVFRITGTAAVLGYAVSHVPDSIWKGASWWTTTKFIFDGVLYGLVTAGTFGWLWPKA